MFTGIRDKSKMKLIFLENFRDFQFSFFNQWMPIGPGQNYISLEFIK